MYRKLPLTLNRGISRWLPAGFALFAFAFAFAGSPLATKSVSAQSQTQNQKHHSAQIKFDEAEAMRAQGMEKSLRSALKKYQEALPL